MKIKVQAQHLQPGDIVGSKEAIKQIIVNSISWPSSKVCVVLTTGNRDRSTLWGKYTLINVERDDD